jgi:hypothetical protein
MGGKIDPAFERAMLFLKNSEEEYRSGKNTEEKSVTENVKRSTPGCRYPGVAGNPIPGRPWCCLVAQEQGRETEVDCHTDEGGNHSPE